MIVVAIIALLAAIAVPNFMRARKRSQATQILEDLRILDQAVDQYAIETNRKAGDIVSWADLQGYVKPNTRLYSSNGRDIHGHEMCYTVRVDQNSSIRVCSLSFHELSDVAPLEFWSPYGVEGMGLP
jgi:type II secretory pathway pseudopilin PulG